ncbi:HNH endonuclease [Nostoc sp. C117]|uniref:HNH endonuclease n=1 Tax=Nostoc sp. C117 TaxID=3349875 RepID=UPI00370D1A73
MPSPIKAFRFEDVPHSCCKCCIEAAHIVPYRNQDSHNIANGLLLRVDLHRLFVRTIHCLVNPINLRCR